MRAAELYFDLDNQQYLAGYCCEEAGELQLAARYYLAASPAPWRGDAPRCYEAGQCWRDAALQYEQLDDVDGVLRCCYRIPDYNFVLTFLLKVKGTTKVGSEQEWKEKEQECVKKAAIYYHGLNQAEEMMIFVLKFSTSPEKRRFLERYHYFDKLLDIELDDKNYLGAAHIYEDLLCDLDKAAEFYEKGGRDSWKDAVRCLLKLVRIAHLDSKYVITATTPGSPAARTSAQLLSRAAVLVEQGKQLDPSTKLLALEVKLLQEFCGSSSTPKRKELRCIYDSAADIERQQQSPQLAGAWKLKATILHYLISNHIGTLKASVKDKGRDKDAATEELSPHLFVRLCHDFADLVSPFIAGLESALQARVMISSQDRSTLLQCLEYFEMGIKGSRSSGRGSTVANNNTLQQQLGRGSLVYSPAAVAGVAEVFQIQASSKNSVLVLRIQEFAQQAKLFLESEVVSSLHDCSQYMIKIYREVHQDTMGDKAGRMHSAPVKAKRPVFQHHCARQLRLLQDLLESEEKRSALLISKQFNHTTLSSSPNLSASDKKEAEILTLEEISSSLLNLLFPSAVELVDLESLVEFRTMRSGPHLKARAAVVARLQSTLLKQPHLKYNNIGKALLVAELVGHGETRTRLSNVVHTELRYGQLRNRHMDKTYDTRRMLVNAFNWQHADASALPPSFACLGPTATTFLYSLTLGAEAVSREMNFGAVYIAIGGDPKKATHPTEGLRNGVLAPTTLMKLVEKNFVWLLLHQHQFRHVFMHYSLAADVLCRDNTVYAAALLNYRGKSTDDLNTSGSGSGSGSPGEQLKQCCRLRVEQMVDALLGLLEHLTAENFAAWCSSSGEEALSPSPPLACNGSRRPSPDVYKDARETFLAHAVLVVIVATVNLPPPSRRWGLRKSYCLRLSKILGSRNPCALKRLPHFQLTFLQKIDPYSALHEFAEYCRNSENDEMIVLGCWPTEKLPSYIHKLVEASRARVKVMDTLSPAPGTAIICLTDLPNDQEKVQPLGAGEKDSVMEKDIDDESQTHEEEKQETQSRLNASSKAFVPATADIERPDAPVPSLAGGKVSHEDRMAPFYQQLRVKAARARVRVQALTPLDLFR